MISSDDPLRPQTMQELDPFDLCLLDLELARRHLDPVLERDAADATGPQPDGRAGDVERRGGGGPGRVGLGQGLGFGLVHAVDPGGRSGPSGSDLTERAPGRVQRNVASPDDDHVVAELDPVPEVDVQEEVHRAKHAVEVDTGDLKIAAPHRTDAEEHRSESVLLERGQAEVLAQT